MASLSGFHHVALSVSDCDASAAWYMAVLGFEELFREESPDRRACVMRFPASGYSIGVVEHSGADGAFDIRQIGLDHVAFAVESRAELEHWEQRLADRGVEHSGVVDIPAGAILNFKDLDGIALALFWDGP